MKTYDLPALVELAKAVLAITTTLPESWETTHFQAENLEAAIRAMVKLHPESDVRDWLLYNAGIFEVEEP